MNNIVDTFVINLDRSKDRMKTIDKNMKDMQIPYKRWDAVDGKRVERTSKNTTLACRVAICSDGIVGCYLSHLSLWKHIIDNYRDGWFLVCEDDVELTKKTINNIGNIFLELQHWQHSDDVYPEMISLACAIMCKHKKVTEHLYRTPIVNGTSAYLVSYAGAIKLYQIMNTPIRGHVDLTLTFMQLINTRLAYYTSDSFVISVDNYGSTISANTFPQLAVSIANTALKISGANSYIHIVYESSILNVMGIGVNIMIIQFIVFIAVMIRYDLLIEALIYIILEVLFFLYSVRSKSQ